MTFIPGLQLSEVFFSQAIQPLMAAFFPDLAYSAARLGFGSDVLGFDTPMSMDHGWGPKIDLFLSEDDYEGYQPILDSFFAQNLPFTIQGLPTNFAEPFADGGVMKHKESYPIHHMVSIITVGRFFADYLGVDIHRPLTPERWLTIPQQRLATIRAGKVFYDGLDQLTTHREKFHWYPQDLWLYLLANQWRRIDQLEPFIGRTGSVGDELRCRLVTAQLVQDLMRVGFLIEKQCTPYIKWFGSAFQKLKIAEILSPLLKAMLEISHWEERETYLGQACGVLIDQHNLLEITPPIKKEISPFYERPFLVPHSSRIVTALLDAIKDPSIRALPPHLGGINQFIDNTDVLDDISHCKKLQNLYEND